MSTNLVILYPQITFLGTKLAATTAATGYESEKMINGARSETYKTNAAVTTSDVDFDYGSDIQPDFFLYSRADFLLAQGGTNTVKLIGSASSTFSSPSTTSEVLSASNLYGTANEDYINFPVSTTSRRYWRAEVTSTNSYKHQYSKFYAGVAFDFGVDPYFPRTIKTQFRGTADRRVKNTFTFRWKGISNTIRNSFISKIYKYKDVNSVFLATRDYHDVLNEVRILNCWILDARFTPTAASFNDLDITFEEAI